MIINIIPFLSSHVDQISMQDYDLEELSNTTESHWKNVEALKWQRSIVIDGKVEACYGVVEYWKGRGEYWALIDRNSGSKLVPMVRAMMSLLNEIDCKRIEVTVIYKFKQAHRLAILSGFELEAPLMKKYGVTGLDYSLYARIQP